MGIVQIETLGALDSVEEIAAIPGVDVLFVGPADLSTALSIQGSWMPHVPLGGVPRGGATRDAGIAAGILARSPEHAAACLEDGFTFVGVGSDATLLASAAKAVTSCPDRPLGRSSTTEPVRGR